MAIRQLTADEIPNIDDGTVGIAINQELRRIAIDSQQRPGLKAARTLNIRLSFKKLFPNDPDSTDYETSVEIESKLPKRSTSIVALTGPDGIEFNDKSGAGEDPRQLHIDDDG